MSKPRPAPAAKTPEQLMAGAWRKARGGLFWVLVALFFLALPGFVGFGKTLYTRQVGELPKGDGADWVRIEGYINDGSPNAIPLTKTDIMNIAGYGIPAFLAGLALIMGRMTAGAAPRSSGARGLFAMSGLFTLAAFGGIITYVACDALLFRDEARYGWLTFILCAPVAEFWFLVGLTACGLSLKRPKTARAVGMVGFVAVVIAGVVLVGWDLYVQNSRPKKQDLNADWLLYEQAALMLGWLLTIGIYWRAVGSVRGAISEYLDAVAQK